MIKIDSFLVNDTFFAARNSHNGFQSHFDGIFNPKDYTRLFILKGGPGTGKSTFMRGLVSFANGSGIDAEAVLCSSDPSSLDGVIMENGGNRVAVIDGTAPHCQDPIFPGAIDTIINLGDGFDTDLLEAKRDDILTLSESKGREYKSAYSALKSAKGVFDYIWHSLCNSKFYNEAELLSKVANFDYIGEDFTAAESKKLYSAFGKDGYKTLPPAASKTVVKIGGSSLLVSLFLDAVCRDLKGKNLPAIRIPSALDDRLAERVIVGNSVLISSENCDCDINLGEYNIEKFCPYFTTVCEAYSSLLALAKSHFRAASDAHFGLEDIYSSAMDFENNERLFANICDWIADIFA